MWFDPELLCQSHEEPLAFNFWSMTLTNTFNFLKKIQQKILQFFFSFARNNNRIFLPDFKQISEVNPTERKDKNHSFFFFTFHLFCFHIIIPANIPVSVFSVYSPCILLLSPGIDTTEMEDNGRRVWDETSRSFSGQHRGARTQAAVLTASCLVPGGKVHTRSPRRDDWLTGAAPPKSRL